MEENKIIRNTSRELLKGILFGIIIVSILMSVSYVSAYQRVCLGYSQSLPNEQNPRYTCWHDQCQVCVTDNNYPTHPSKCDGVQGCSSLGEQEIDSDPPDMIVHSPSEGEIFNSRMVLFDLESDEPASFSYLDNINPRGYKRLVSLRDFFEREVSFSDGFQDITIRALDRNYNQFEQSVTFFVDSKDPRVRDTSPDGAFVGSEFLVIYDEDNVKEVKLHYGNDENSFREVLVEGCESGSKIECSVEVGLEEYNEQQIDYWFEIEDIAGNVEESKKVSLFVDEKDPIIKNVEFEQDGRNVNFVIEIEETFFDEVFYVYEERGRTRNKRLCNKLNDGICEGKAGFKDGEYEIKIVALDLAGNIDSEIVNLFVDSKVPKISRTYPKGGFANGIFDVEFTEENPEELLLKYGVEGDIRVEEVNLDECFEDRRTYCTAQVDITAFDGGDIEYLFELTDKVGNKDVSKQISLEVDVTSPEILNENWWRQEGRYVYFDMQIEENNLDEVIYSYEDSRGRIREKRICSRLRDSRCEKRVRFNSGDYSLDVQIIDEAGNAVSERIGFEVL